jgi:hypothetical protein
MKEDQSIANDTFSIYEVLMIFWSWIVYLLKSWKKIVAGAVLIGAVFFLYHTYKKITYTAETTFVLEGSSSDKEGLSSIASMVGFNVSKYQMENELFDVDNITELYRSYRMLKETFLTLHDSGAGNERLISTWIRNKKLDRKWGSNSKLKDLSFEIPIEQMDVRHDSIMMEVVEKFLESHFVVEKLDRKLSILTVKVMDEDELFSKHFNEVIVKKVNQFYLDTKTKRTGENVRILKDLTDSVKLTLDQAIKRYSDFKEGVPNPNPLLAKSDVKFMELQVDIEAASAVYEEAAKNLLIARISHQNNMPLIQIVDMPVLPLTSNYYKVIKRIVFGLIIGGFIMVFLLTAIRIFDHIMYMGDSSHEKG